MFTGLIQSKSKLKAVKASENVASDAGKILYVNRPLDFADLRDGESIAVNGVCLTLSQSLSEGDDSILTFFAGPETLALTTLGDLERDAEINLERSLTLADRLGGHLVSGHVDGTGFLTHRREVGSSLEIGIHVSDTLFQWIVPKGSLCVDGVSLTVNKMNLEESTVEFTLIPETLQRTNLAGLSVGDHVNIECDQTVKIIAHQLKLMGKVDG